MSENNADFINKIFEDAVKDETLLSTLNVDELIEMTNSEHIDYLNEKTMDDLLNEMQNALSLLDVNDKMKLSFYNKLAGYRLIGNIYELHKGKMVRWIRNGTNKLTNGGIVTDIKFLDNGVHVLCMNSQRRFIQYKYDDCYTFQKMSIEEQLILMAYEELS